MIRRCLLLTALLAALAGCSDDGRTLAPIRSGQTTTTTTTTPPTVVDQVPQAFELVSSAWEEGGQIPSRFTCEGTELSPPLGWLATPPGEQLAIVARDLTADGFVHWIVTRIDIGVSGFGQAGVPEGAVEQVNSTGAIGWLGPCPPEGSGAHVYEITLHVLLQDLDIDPALPAAEVAAIIESASGARATLTGTYEAGAVSTESTEPTDDGTESTDDDDQPSVGSQNA